MIKMKFQNVDEVTDYLTVESDESFLLKLKLDML